MKILLASSSSGSRGGGELFLLYLGRGLVARGHEVTLWASSHPRMDELAQSFSSIGQVIRAPYTNTYDRRARSLGSYFNRWGAWRIGRAWSRLPVDVIHVNKQNLEDGLELLQAAARSGKPNLATIHLSQTARYLGAKSAWVRDWIARRALTAYPGLLVAVLENRTKDLRDFLRGSPRVRLVPNGVPLLDLTRRETTRAAQRRELGFNEAHTLFIGVGRMMPQKRPQLFLEHAERIYQRLTHARFLWVGDGPLAGEWDRWVKARGLESVIRRFPWRHDVPALLQGADVFMHTAHFEGLPLAILEAMSAALPLALTPNLPEEMPFLKGTKPALLKAAEIDAAALNDRAELQKRGEAGRRLIEEQFSFEQMAEGYEALYQSVAARDDRGVERGSL
ncbi:MAG TPA: glycosyltransferase family 4 protein [Chthoniobacteraceae bacterium]|jgi:glycosyltransferase involved in cell wall biosynthesis|nr:glycosyltransferase family 4 protein [Chthoniobacteraceae bacterium]